MAEAEGGGEKTEDPTAKKLSDARNKGQIARSKELGTMFVLVGSACGMLLVGGQLVSALSLMMTRLFSVSRAEVMDVHALFSIIESSVAQVMTPLLWFFAIVALAAFAGNTLLGGINFSWEAMAPKASKLSPLAGFKRMFGTQAAVELVKSLLKFFVVFVVAYILLVSLFDEILSLSTENIPINFSHSTSLLLWMFLALTISLIIIAIIDAPYQIWHHNEQLKMTKQEVKDENKNSEGNPEVKGHIRRTQYEMSQRRMMEDVPNADVIITNPTHYSVALTYDALNGGVPKVVARGVDAMALHIRTIAKEHSVEIVQAPALSRSLYYTTKVGDEIPEELFAAVAQVLAFIFQLELFQKGKAKRPTAVAKNLPIPDEFKY
jgi:flagellar biosynthetic protein FlhB